MILPDSCSVIGALRNGQDASFRFPCNAAAHLSIQTFPVTSCVVPPTLPTFIKFLSPVLSSCFKRLVEQALPRTISASFTTPVHHPLPPSQLRTLDTCNKLASSIIKRKLTTTKTSPCSFHPSHYLIKSTSLNGLDT